MIKDILILGAGSAGLIMALTLKRKFPLMNVRIVRSPEIGVIGVGESTTPNLPRHLFEYMGMSRKHFYSVVRPTWKMGIHFIWGGRPFFDYSFSMALDTQYIDLSRPNGFFCEDEFVDVDIYMSFMAQKKAFPRRSDGSPDITPFHAFHLENHRLVQGLEMMARGTNIEFIDAKVKGAEKGPNGIAAVILEDGRRFEADFFIDASGFRSELLGKTLEEPFISFGSSLFCDRACVGSWERTTEDILPYTVAETMDNGWCWQIEHEEAINRGYVYSSAAVSDDEARAELLRKNPKIKTWDRPVKFRSGRHRRLWVDNVLAIGNAGGFVEPLEATALMVVCWQTQTFVDFLLHSGAEPTTSLRDLYNTASSETWDEIRNFLSLHYRFNDRLDTPFWKLCRAEADVSGIKDLLNFYQENGPTGLMRSLIGNTGSQFGVEGFLVQLVGNKVPYHKKFVPPPNEMAVFKARCAENEQFARNGLTVKEALAYVHHPNWRWFGDPQ